jgi:ABC-type bacteriocin/lantibiotic exporter with double-glycine peptidase domain
MNKYSLTPLKRFFRLLQVDKKEITSIYIFSLFNGIIVLSLPLGIQAIINLISTGQVSTSWVVLVVFVILGIAFSGIIQIMQLVLAENIQQKIFARSAFEFAYRIPRLRLEVIDKHYIPELVNRFFDTLSVQKGLSKILLDFSSASLQVVFGLILLCLYHPFFILFSTMLVIILYFIFRLTAPKGLSTSIKESANKYEVAHWLEELARNIGTFKLAGKTTLPLQKTDDVVLEYLNSRKLHFKTLLAQYINLVGFKVLIALGLLLIGGLLVINQQMNIGQFVASEIIIILVLASIEKLILSMETIYDVLTSLEKIGNVVDIELEKSESNYSPPVGDNGLTIELKNLSYKFPDSENYILQNINLQISAGEKLCLTGFNGSGKSFLLQVVAGLYYDFKGSILYNDIPFANWDKEYLRNHIGNCLTKEDIFKGSIIENITLGRESISFEQVREACKIVGLVDYIKNVEGGYENILIPEGKNLSKTTRTKILLARSIAHNSKLILIEDSFIELDKIERDRFLSHLLSLKSTVIIISSNIEVAGMFERVVVLEKGNIIADDKFINIKNNNWFNQVFQKK